MKTEPIFQPSTNLAPFLAIALSGLAIAICLAAHVRAQELQLIESRPLGGTFYSLQKLDREPPLPYNRFPELPLYWLGEGIYAVDDRSVDYVALAQQAELEAALSAMESTLDGPPAPGEGGGDPGTNSVPPAYSYSTNDLWLEMAGLTNDTAYLVVHSPEPDGVFDLFATTNLSPNGSGLNLTNWAWLARSEPGQTNFVVVELSATETWFRLGRTNDADADGLTDAFENLVSHSDPQEADSDADGLPDGWEWKHFGNFGQGAGDDYDQDDVSNLDEYYAGSDPNSIAFRTIFNNLRVNSTGATGTVTVIKGVPAKLAVLVDSTNFASASWVSYGSTFTVGLGSTEGRHDVWVGLKGQADTSQATWSRYRLVRDTVPPLIVITNPADPTVFQALLQLQGYSPEPLASLRYDITNDLGTLTNREGYVVKTNRGHELA